MVGDSKTNKQDKPAAAGLNYTNSSSRNPHREQSNDSNNTLGNYKQNSVP